MLIPNQYVLKEGETAPEGAQVCTCRICNTTYAVPVEAANGKTFIDVCDADDCKTAYDKEIAAATAALMKDPVEAKEALDKALGK